MGLLNRHPPLPKIVKLGWSLNDLVYDHRDLGLSLPGSIRVVNQGLLVPSCFGNSFGFLFRVSSVPEVMPVVGFEGDQHGLFADI